MTSWQGVLRMGAGWLVRWLEAYGCIHLRAFGDGGEASHGSNDGAVRPSPSAGEDVGKQPVGSDAIGRRLP